MRAMGGCGRMTNQRGIALPTAIVAALVVSITALVVLNLTMRRFELSAFRSDHVISMVSSEAGFQYAFARLNADAAFENAVRTDDDPPYVLSPLAVGTQITVPYDGGQQQFVVDEQDAALVTDRDVHVLLEEFAENPPVAPPRLRVHAYSDFGTGQ